MKGGSVYSYHKETEDAALEAGKITLDAICPLCFRPVDHKMIPVKADRYGREIRSYMGFCRSCQVGCEVVQFRRDDRWVIHRYQLYKYVGQNIHCVGTGQWTTLNELPDPAPIVVGPGGDFDQRITPQVGELLGITDMAAFHEVGPQQSFLHGALLDG